MHNQRNKDGDLLIMKTVTRCALFCFIALSPLAIASEKSVCSNVGSSFFIDASGVKLEVPYRYYVTTPQLDYGAQISLISPELQYVKNQCEEAKKGFIHVGLVRDFNQSYFKNNLWAGFVKKEYKKVPYWQSEVAQYGQFIIVQIFVEFGENFILMADVDENLRLQILEKIVELSATNTNESNKNSVIERLEDLRKLSK